MPASDYLSLFPAVGTLAGGPVGGAIGTAAAGIGGIIDSGKKQKEYQKAENAINPIDPAQQAFLGRLRRQENNLRAGTDASSAMAQRLAGNINAQTQGNLLRAGGTGTVNNLLRAQATLGNQIQGIGASAGQNANALLGPQGNLIDSIADRVYKRKQELRNQALARTEQQRGDARANLLAGGVALPQANFNGIFAKRGIVPPAQGGGNAMLGGGPGLFNPSMATPSTGYSGMSTGQAGDNYGFGYNPPPQTNYGF